MRKTLLTMALVMACLLMMQTAAMADPLTSITVGDKTFNNFTCNVITIGTGTPGSGPCGSAITVSAFTDAFGNIGIQFQLGASTNSLNSSVEIGLGYDVTVNNGTNLISDIHMSFNGAVLGSGLTHVTETVNGINPATGVIGQIQVVNPPPVLDAQIVLSQPVQSAHVIKDIFLSVGGTAGTATISSISQTFSQTTVPEPASMLLLGTGLCSLAGVLRRKLHS